MEINRLPFRLDLQHFAEGETGIEQTVDTDEQSETNVEAEKMFTQSDIDDAVRKRLERERKKYEGFDDFKTKASEYDKLVEEKRLAEMSEKERLEEVAKKYEDEKSGLMAELEALRESIKSEKIRTEFIKVATSENIAYIDDALALADLSSVSIDDSGKIIGVDDVVKSLVENKPFLVAKKQSKPIGESTNSQTERADKTAEQMLAEAAEKARLSGRNEDRAAYAKLKRELGY